MVLSVTQVLRMSVQKMCSFLTGLITSLNDLLQANH